MSQSSLLPSAAVAPLQFGREGHINGILALLPVTGLIFAMGIWLRGQSLDPTAATEAFMQAAIKPGAATAWIAIFVGMVLELPAVVALGARLGAAKLGWWGMILNLVGVALVLPMIGFMALASPQVAQLYLAGNAEGLAVATAYYSTPLALTLLAISGIAYSAGSILLALELRRQWRAPWFVVMAFALQAFCLSILGAFSFVAEFAGALLLIYAGIWIVRRAGQEE